MVAFNWTSVKKRMVCREQRPVAVYVNPYGQIVIRAQGDSGYQDDQVVIVDPTYVPALIAALTKALGEVTP